MFQIVFIDSVVNNHRCRRHRCRRSCRCRCRRHHCRRSRRCRRHHCRRRRGQCSCCRQWIDSFRNL